MIEWWHQVTVHPERSNINVFKRGICQGFKTFNPLGGHIEPISIAGDKLLWKKAQKKAKKNKISDTINKIVPKRRPIWTIPVYDLRMYLHAQGLVIIRTWLKKVKGNH